MKKLLPALILLISCSCNQSSSDTGNTENPSLETTPITTPSTFSGTFTGTTPCADCPGIYTVLEFLPDQDFYEYSDYLDRNTNFMDTGRWQQNDSIITVTFSKGAQDRYFKVLNDSTVSMLDAEKKPITSPLADFYILRKKDTLITR